MGIFTFKRSFFNEAEVDDNKNTNKTNNEDDEEEDDYTAGADGAGDDENNDGVDDNSTDDDNAGGDDDTSTNEDDDYTAGADGAADDESNDVDDNSTDDNAGGDDDTSTNDEDDYTSMDDDDTNTDGDDTSDSSDTGGDEGDDYTAGADGAGDDENNDDVDTGEGEDIDTESDLSYENLKKIESELFSNLTPEQIAIKNGELMNRFTEIYSTISSALLRINDINKTDDNIDILNFVTDKFIELKDIVDFNIYKAFITRTYIENSIVYQECLNILNILSEILNNIPSNKSEDNIENSNLDRYNLGAVDDGNDDYTVSKKDDMIAVGHTMESYSSFIDNIKLI